jgi:hypothetical protein
MLDLGQRINELVIVVFFDVRSSMDVKEGLQFIIRVRKGRVCFRRARRPCHRRRHAGCGHNEAKPRIHGRRSSL